MIVERHTIPSCCGNTSIIFKTDKPLDLNMIDVLVKFNFIEQKHFTKAGILYVENKELVLTGPIGSNKIQVKCKKKDCANFLNSLENDIFSKL